MSDDLITIVGIDPGINTLGLALVKVNAKTLEIDSIEASTIKPAMGWSEDPYSLSTSQADITRDEKLKYVGECVLRKLGVHIVTVIGIEAPFFNSARPAAYSSLLAQVNDLIKVLTRGLPQVKISLYAPRKIKKIIGAEALLKKNKKITHKEAVKIAIEENKFLMDKIGEGWAELDEHAIDAIAIAITQLELG